MLACSEPAWLCGNLEPLKELIPGNSDFVKEVVKDVLAALIISFLVWLLFQVKKLLRHSVRQAAKAWVVDPDAWRIERLRKASADNERLWLAVPINPPPSYTEWMADQAFVIERLQTRKAASGRRPSRQISLRHLGENEEAGACDRPRSSRFAFGDRAGNDRAAGRGAVFRRHAGNFEAAWQRMARPRDQAVHLAK